MWMVKSNIAKMKCVVIDSVSIFVFSVQKIVNSGNFLF